MKKILVLLTVLSLLVFVGCSKQAKDDVVKIGASPTPHAKILELVKDDLKKEGVNIEIVEFSDYVIPNTSVEEGELFANFFQHKPYLDKFNKEHGTRLVSIGSIHVEPMGVYSKSLKNIDELKALSSKITVALPNDPSNEGRALLLLEKKGLIKLKDSKNLNSTPIDIVENKLNIEFKEIEAAQLPRVLDDVTLAVINTNYVLESKLDIKPLVLEDKESPYANIVVVNEKNKDSELAKKIIKVLQSKKVKEYINKEFKGKIVPAF